MDNQLQICNWLVEHPDVLQLAYKMLNTKDRAISSSTLPQLAVSESSDNVSVIISLYYYYQLSDLYIFLFRTNIGYWMKN